LGGYANIVTIEALRNTSLKQWSSGWPRQGGGGLCVKSALANEAPICITNSTFTQNQGFHGAGDTLTISVHNDLDFSFYGTVKSKVAVADLTGPFTAPQVIDVTVQGDQAHLTGDINGDSLVDLEDAIIAGQILSSMNPDLPFYPDPKDAAVIPEQPIGSREMIYILRETADLPSPN